jgi:hypothetical protein
MEMQPLEAVWTTEEEFIVCGGDFLSLFTVSDGTIMRARKFETREDHRLSKVTYDRHSRLLATASEDGIIDVSYVHNYYCPKSAKHNPDMGSFWPMPFHNSSPRANHSTAVATDYQQFGCRK